MAWIVELHMHTTASDGAMEPHVAVCLAEKRGLAAVAVTDHDTFRGSSLAARAARAFGFNIVVVPAAEIRTSVGDVLVYCPHEPTGEPPARPSVEELHDWASGNSCILVPAHPYHPVRSSMGGRALHEYSRYWAAVEAWNSRGPPFLNLPALRAARRLGLPATSGSDAHVEAELGVSPVELEEEPRNPEAVVEAVRKGRLKITPGIPGPKALVEALAWGLAKRLGLHED